MFFSEKRNQFKTFTRRSLLLLFVKLGLFTTVTYKLYNIQIVNSKKYKTLSESNRINLKIINPTRGLIYDRNHKLLATNYETYELFLIPEQIDDIGNLFKSLSKVINIPFKQRKKVISLSKKMREFEMIKILDNLNWSQLELIETNMINLPGVHLLPHSKRYYPHGNYFSHIIGYTSQPSKEDMELPYISSMPSLEIGKTGVEKYFNKSLIGKPGRREVEISAIGKEIREISRIESIKGDEINISIDLKIQKTIYNQLKNIISGSVVVMNVNTGEIIGMHSKPSFNPNKLISKPNMSYWNEILNNNLSPLTNRVIQGLYSPGSTFKLVVALAALEKNIIDLNTNVNCKGKIEFGDRFFHCWKTKGHGNVSLIKGIKESCDCYFYELANRLGIDEIAKMAKKLGLGSFTNIELPSEKKGIIPNMQWKKNTLKESWYKGETLIAGIGQGYILTTPIQLARMTSIIANGGNFITPTLILNNSKKENNQRKINLNIENINYIKDAMTRVVNENLGTAFASRSDKNKYIFAGKTGSSQVIKITLEEREREDFRKKEIKWKNKDHALFVGYMPVEKPKYSICVIIEHGGSGSSIAAPIAREVFNEIYKLSI